MNNYKTRPVGEVFRYGLLNIKVEENSLCKGCYFNYGSRCLYSLGITGYCGESIRNDDKNVIFKRIIE